MHSPNVRLEYSRPCGTLVAGWSVMDGWCWGDLTRLKWPSPPAPVRLQVCLPVCTLRRIRAGRQREALSARWLYCVQVRFICYSWNASISTGIKWVLNVQVYCTRRMRRLNPESVRVDECNSVRYRFNDWCVCVGLTHCTIIPPYTHIDIPSNRSRRYRRIRLTRPTLQWLRLVMMIALHQWTLCVAFGLRS